MSERRAALAEPETTTPPSLTELAESINFHHRQVSRAGEHAWHCGGDLIIAKKLVGHGNWLPWLKIHFESSPRTAAYYMTLRRKFADPCEFAGLTLQDALRESDTNDDHLDDDREPAAEPQADGTQEPRPEVPANTNAIVLALGPFTDEQMVAALDDFDRHRRPGESNEDIVLRWLKAAA
jgi:hypothetical protein